MRIDRLYCDARHQCVRVVTTDEPTHDGQAPLTDSEVVCLDCGTQRPVVEDSVI